MFETRGEEKRGYSKFLHIPQRWYVRYIELSGSDGSVIFKTTLLDMRSLRKTSKRSNDDRRKENCM